MNRFNVNVQSTLLVKLCTTYFKFKEYLILMNWCNVLVHVDFFCKIDMANIAFKWLLLLMNSYICTELFSRRITFWLRPMITDFISIICFFVFSGSKRGWWEVCPKKGCWSCGIWYPWFWGLSCLEKISFFFTSNWGCKFFDTTFA